MRSERLHGNVRKLQFLGGSVRLVEVYERCDSVRLHERSLGESDWVASSAGVAKFTVGLLLAVDVRAYRTLVRSREAADRPTVR